MPVSDKHRDYTNNVDKWELVRDCVEGGEKIKDGGVKYLPMPNVSDQSTENKARYDAYKTRATFVNYTANTKDGLVGMVARKPAVIEFGSNVEYLIENATGGGITLNEVLFQTIGELLETGRYGFLADHPEVEEGASRRQTAGINSYLSMYDAENIINWRTEIIDGEKAYTLIVLQEAREIVREDGFGADYFTWYRVLQLVDGIYMQSIYDHNGMLVQGEIIPRKANGSTWDRIPFVFAGSENNDESPDKAPLLDIADLNVAHYRNSADFEESAFIVGQPTPVLAGLTQAWVKDVFKGKVHLGSRAAIPLPEGGSATLMQANENQMPSKGMEIKEQQIIQIGGRLIRDTGGVETAEAAKIRFAGQNSKLARVVHNAEKAILRTIDYIQEFMGGESENVIEANRQYYDAKVDPQMVMAKLALLDRQVIAMSDLRNYLKEVGEIDEEREGADIDDEARELDPLAQPPQQAIEE